MQTQSIVLPRVCARWLLSLAAIAAVPAGAQSLDEAVARELAGDCITLGTPDGNNPGPIVNGPDLHAICSMSFGSNRGTANSGGGGASSQTVAASVENRRKARLEEESAQLGSRWGVFLNANGEALERERTRFADGFDSSVLGATVGADYRVASSLIVGIAGAYRNTTGDFEGGGDFDTQSVGGSLYLSFVPSADSFFDLSVGYASKSHEVSRRAQFSEIAISGTLRNDFDDLVDSDTDGTELGTHARFGYDFKMGRWTVGPRLGASWTQTEVDGYSETGGGRGTVVVGGIRGAAGLALIYEDQEAESLQGLAGAQASFTANPSFGALVVQVTADYIHEFDNEQRRVNVSFVQDLRPNRKVFQYQTEEPVEGFVKAGLSFVFVLQGGIQPFINLQGMIGNEQFKSNYAATLGVRFEL